MAEQVKFVSFANLSKYNELLQKQLNGVNTAIVNAVSAHDNDIKGINADIADINKTIGEPSSTEGGGTEASGLIARIEDIESNMGKGGSVATQIKTAIEDLDVDTFTAGVASTDGKVTVGLTQADGKISALTVVTSDIASAQDLDDLTNFVGELPEDTEAETVIEYINKAVEDAQGETGDLAKLVGFTPEEGEGKPQTVVAYVDAKVKAEADRINAIVGTPDEGTIQDEIDAVEADIATLMGDGEGSVAKAVKDESDRVDGIIGDLGKVKDAEGNATETDHTVVTYVESEIAKVNGEATTLAGRVKATEDAIDLLNGDAKVEGSVAHAVNEAVTDLIDGAPDALNTLKEIADWIANQDESGVTDATSLISRVDTLTGADTVAGSVAKAEKDAKAYADGLIGSPDENMTIQGEIDAVEARLDVIEGEGAGSVKKAEADAKAYTDTQIGEIPPSVGEGENAVETKTVIAYLNAKIAEVNGDNSALAGRVTTAEADIDVLEALHVEGKTVAEEAQDAIDAIAEVSKNNVTADLVTVTVTTEAGSVSAVAVDDSALDTSLKGITDRLDVIEGEGDGSIAKAVKAEADRVDGIIGKSTDTETATTVYGAIATVDAKIGAFTPCTNDEIASLFGTNNEQAGA